MFVLFIKSQKLTHYIEDLRELIYAYLAFTRTKNNPNIIIEETN